MKYSDLIRKTKPLSAELAIKTLLADPKLDELLPETLNAIANLLNKGEAKAANKKDIANPFWIAAQFVAKNDVRYYLNYIHSTGEELHASDGCTAVMVKYATALGYYTPSGVLVEPETFARYPNINQALSNLKLDGNLYDITKPQDETAENVKLGPAWFNRKYVERAIKIGITEAKINESMLYFEKDNIKGLICHVRI